MGGGSDGGELEILVAGACGVVSHTFVQGEAGLGGSEAVPGALGA